MVSSKIISSVFVAGFVIACGGGSSDTPATTPTASNTAPPPSNAKAEQCHAIAKRVDALKSDAAKVDMHQVEGMTSLQTLSTQASTDLAAMHADEPLAGILHDSSDHLAEASKVFGQLAMSLGRIEDAKKKIAPEALGTIKTCVVDQVKVIATYCKGQAHPSADCTAVKKTIDAWGAADDDHQFAALGAVKALVVTDKTVKPHYDKVVVCVQPLADAIGQIDAEKSKLTGLGDAEDAREKKIDERFAAECGRKLFNEK
jgi:hypothetical protein